MRNKYSLTVSLLSHELAEHVLKDAAVLIEGYFRVSVKSAGSRERFARAGCHGNVLVDTKVATLHVNVESLRTIESMSISALTSLELERQNAHANEVASVDTLIGLSDHSVNSLEVGALGSPIAGRARAVLVTGQDNELFASILVLLSGVEDSHLFAGGNMDGSGANLRYHLVDEADIGERATSHNLIITSAGTVRVEVLGGNIAICQETGGGRILCNLTSG
jgi:hypothetical protein